MANILIYSHNPHHLADWSHALTLEHNVNTLLNVHGEFNADAVIFDAEKLEDDVGFFQVFSNKSARFLVVGCEWSEQQQINLLLHGASGYCETADTANQLGRAVDSILKGDVWIKRSLVPKVISLLSEHKQSHLSRQSISLDMDSLIQMFATLSVRELEVANMIGQGESNKRIAQAMNISERTVKAHLSAVFRKLAVEDRLRLAIRLKEIEQYRSLG